MNCPRLQRDQCTAPLKGDSRELPATVIPEEGAFNDCMLSKPQIRRDL